jgi:hypothetical protein
MPVTGSLYTRCKSICRLHYDQQDNLRKGSEDNQMSAPSLSTCTFQIRRDEFSAQVSCDQDPKFWFRLETAENRDNITDFFLGAFDPSLGGDLLATCYKKLAKKPNHKIVFGNFLPGGPSDPAAIETAKARFEGYAKTMLAVYGRSVHASHVLDRRKKFDLVIDSIERDRRDSIEGDRRMTEAEAEKPAESARNAFLLYGIETSMGIGMDFPRRERWQSIRHGLWTRLSRPGFSVLAHRSEALVGRLLKKLSL